MFELQESTSLPPSPFARRPLYLVPPNECDIPKFVCTTLRPSLLPYPGMYTLESEALVAGSQ